VGTNMRCLRRLGRATPEAVVAGAVDDVGETLVQIALVLVTLPFVEIAIDTSALAVRAPSAPLIAAVVTVLVLIVVPLFSVPKLRAKLLPPIRLAFSSLWSV